MATAKLYKIKNWDALYENNRTRELKKMQWVPVPNDHDGDGYTVIMSQEDGAAILGGFLVCLQVASKCTPRGVLKRHNGLPHTAETLNRISRIPAAVFERVFEVTTSLECEWLEYELTESPQDGATTSQEGAGISHHDAGIPQEGAALSEHSDAENVIQIPQQGAGKSQEGATIPQDAALKGMEGNGREGKTRKEELGGKVYRSLQELTLPDPYNTPELNAAWQSWLQFRKEIGKKVTPMSAKQHIKLLQQWGAKKWTDAINQSITCGWQGLFEPKQSSNTKPSYNGPNM